MLGFIGQSDRLRFWALAAGLVGAALFYGDGIITPAISVLSAVEGLNVATPFFEPYVVPISLALLIALFAIQRRGTAAVGRLFGPLMLLWFAVLGLLGIVNIVQHPRILLALNPIHGVDLILGEPWRGFAMIGAVFLAVTGTETLYADMGHFGRDPLRRAWLSSSFRRFLNYLGQAGLLLSATRLLWTIHSIERCQGGGFIPWSLASTATIVAQAVISGAFSITRQPCSWLCRTPHDQTHLRFGDRSSLVPKINWALLAAIILLVLVFRYL